ncbi:MAG TPA: hypothetical protein VFM25_02455 [Verrucomicrobiae bacterium]|nr:hypothetical protein [Verrucomicrobiae bacterium]
MKKARRGTKFSIGILVGSGTALFLFYFWLVSKAQAQQLVAGAIIGIVVTAAMAALASQVKWHFFPSARGVGSTLLRLPGKILRDIGVLTMALCRALMNGTRPTGSFKEIPFSAGGNDARSAGRRAMVEAGMCAPPNSIAISVEENKNVLLAHQLVSKTEPPADKEWPL